MDFDLIFVSGALLLVLALPSFLSALLERSMPRVSALLVIIGGLMIGYAVMGQPGAYTLRTLPDVVVNVVARFL